ncbi:hypothetical protein [Pseudonocardia xinjiangensis]|uniref:Uncharacterized protein n=1 Tax=Pseudonocardia xinjiangensis TaxID=75289 RepID=A0ABX1RIS5_9PSEU|nr:hypothetical protein [Pseudonocardia xinjiangensis]NMH79839.1 hypothetical protein [Pseudonocardia xinjiangensis]
MADIPVIPVDEEVCDRSSVAEKRGPARPPERNLVGRAGSDITAAISLPGFGR